MTAARSATLVERIVIFDGVCNLCSTTAQFIVRRDAQGRFRFAAAQSAKGRALLIESGVDPDRLETFVLRKDGHIFVRSDAALEIAKELDGLWPVLVVLRMVPRALRDWMYDVVARNRYRWFGKKQECMIPGADIQSRFIE